jgi:hypothetical protein
MSLLEIEELEGLSAPLTGEQWGAIGVAIALGAAEIAAGIVILT